MGLDIGDRYSTLFTGLSGFWQRFFRDTQDLEAFYQASEIYLGQVYLDLLGAVLNIGIVDAPIFNKEYWKLFLIDETQVHFHEGVAVMEDRYWFDMPNTAVTTDFLQNTIFDPDVVFERGVDFDVVDNDGYLRFYADPFKGTQDTNGEWLPRPGIGWRTIQKEIGNQFTDQLRKDRWQDDSDVKRGDLLALLAYPGAKVQEGVAGEFISGLPTLFRDTVAFNSALCQEGDIVIVSGAVAPDEQFNGVYVVGRNTAPFQVDVEPTFYLPNVSSSTPLKWKHYRGVYFSTEQLYEVDYFDKYSLVGSADNPYPLTVTSPIVYSVLRDIPNNLVMGQPITGAETICGFRHLVPGSVIVHATVGGSRVKEGEHYTVDYLRGRLHQLVPFTGGAMTFDYRFRKEVFYSAGGVVTAKDVGRVKQIALWVPEVMVDRFNLYYNYGSLLNRFAASSETYKAFLRGIMYLYVSGPVLERIEAALNVAAGYPVVKNDGEVLAGYDNGEVAHFTADGTITGATRYFFTPSYTFGEIDVGCTIIFPSPTIDYNKGKFRILEVINEHTVELESSYGFIDEPGLEWVLTRTYQKTVTTNLNTYKFPYNVPMREDVMDPTQVGWLTFEAFEALTEGFRVTDYIEDPRWWHNKYIPSILWNESIARRYATTQLYEHVIGPSDDLRIGDPGFFIGADDEGNVFSPTDGLGVTPVSLHRHCTAFILFDRYLKCHIFYVDISPDLELSTAFVKDLEELILVAKPSYTYPYVEPNSAMEELATLTEVFRIAEIGFHISDNLMVADNNLVIGDTDFPWNIGGYYRYIDHSASIPGTAGVISPGDTFRLPVNLFVPPVPGPMVLEQRLVDAVLHATVGGRPVLEGTDYRIYWRVDDPDAWWVKVTSSGTWDPLALDLDVDLLLVEYDNVAYTPTPDTTIGFTPLFVGGLNPAFVRRGALDPDSAAYAVEWAATRSRFVERALSLHINDGGPYTYTG